MLRRRAANFYVQSKKQYASHCQGKTAASQAILDYKSLFIVGYIILYSLDSYCCLSFRLFFPAALNFFFFLRNSMFPLQAIKRINPKQDKNFEPPGKNQTSKFKGKLKVQSPTITKWSIRIQKRMFGGCILETKFACSVIARNDLEYLLLRIHIRPLLRRHVARQRCSRRSI